tara:strand:- start:339 stop:725 length:387 start_codon:yes stop_codon:yes gene_type:complete
MPNIEIQIDTFQTTSVTTNGQTNIVPVNSTVQVGDTIYYSTPVGLSSIAMSDPIKSGVVTGFTISGYIKAYVDDGIFIPDNAFILFSKPIQINESSVKGYYADVTLENSSNKKAELFALSSEIVPSSK